MTFGNETPEDEAYRMVHMARDKGINLFDTANVYNAGESERILGRIVRDFRNDIILATKAFFPTGKGANQMGGSRLHLVQALEDSLVRLGTDRIDIFFLHKFDQLTPLEETLRSLELLVQSGKILSVGVSNFSAWQTMKAVGIAEKNSWLPISCVQPMYNLIKRQAEVEILPLCEAEGLACFPYNPLAGGLLTGKYGSSCASSEGRLRDNKMYEARYGFKANLAVAENLKNLAGRLGVETAAFAIAWVMNHRNVTAPLIGARNVEQLKSCLKVLEYEVNPSDLNKVSELTPEPPFATDRSEEGGQYTFEGMNFGLLK